MRRTRGGGGDRRIEKRRDLLRAENFIFKEEEETHLPFWAP